jgi:predicted ATP-binding protein involved in virulence
LELCSSGVNGLQIERVSLKNFRGIQEAEIAIEGKCAIFFGINGSGKSTILKAVNLLFSNIINKIVSNRFKQGVNIEIIDITNGQKTATVEATFSFGSDKKITYHRVMNRGNRKLTHSPKDLVEIKQVFDALYLSPESKTMPVFINYGVNRLVLQVPLRITKKHEFDKLSAFEKAIESKIDFRTFFEWFRNQEDIENAIKVANKDFTYKDKPLTAVKKAVRSLLGDIDDIRVQRRPLSMEVERDKKFLKIEQLSDGEKCTLALIGDIARRLALANPHSENSNNGSGIVLIDEIELHMHPTWQRRIPKALADVFPNIQFIITTHSPQILGEADENYKIFNVNIQKGRFDIERYAALDAWSSNEILESLMETSESSINAKGDFADMFELIDSGKYDEAEKIVEKLKKKSHPCNPDLINARMLIQKGRRGL